jgi:GNAT superfamily N-acetyltransferase
VTPSSPLTFTTSLAGVGPEDLAGGFFEGWSAAPTPQQHLEILRGSTHVVLAVEGAAVVGFANAISDGVLSAYIPLLEVLPTYRGNGTGSRLIELLLEALGGLYMVDVMCDDDVRPFYARLGFQPGGGMIRRNYAWTGDAAP